ncbi:MAG: tRNA pseudouridine(38-40) synthase TruA [Bacteroidales bacterium]|nr:tRNA pseudouridine(38-40) synthase TruA [Bacteroidales bacterium]
MRYFIHLAYNGEKYHGWQIQPNASSVQETLERAMSLLLGVKISLVGAGRTDTGVHARSMTAHFEVEDELHDKGLLVEKLNRFLPPDIAIYDIRRVKDDAHARFSALSRTYRYYVSTKKNPFKKDFVWRINGSLDIEQMNKAAEMLFRYVDFTSFSKLHTDTKTNNCKIMHAEWTRETDTDFVFEIKADRFLRNMVRAIVGTLVEVGKGKMTVDDFCRVIEKKNRCAAGNSVPAHALFLVDVGYPEEVYMI